jgi:hypothetical protein
MAKQEMGSSWDLRAGLWRWRAHWSLTLYPDAREGSGQFVSAGRRSQPTAARGDAVGERSAVEGARRARVKIRRYCAANQLNRLGTLTYAGEGCHDEEQVRADMAEFFRRLRRGMEVKALPTRLGATPTGSMPYLWVPQWHPGGHGLHTHFAVGRYIPRAVIEASWPHGFVSIKLLSGLSTGSGPLEEARHAARYLAKYAGKQLDEDLRRSGLHRYEVAEGFQPEEVRLRGRSPEELIEQASQTLGRKPKRVSNSDEWEGWRGPPTFTVEWPG